MTLSPAHRERPPRKSSITRRKELAQEIRNELDTYRRLVTEVSDETRDRRVWRIDSKFAELLALEGFER